jgi:mono/diheme cytochrome c family protein
MSHRNALILAIGVLSILGTMMAQSTPTAAHPQNGAKKDQPVVTGTALHGERVFQQNCSRCHNAPQGFPPQISGTILRHMRVRASLTAADENALLQFLNP